MYRKVLTITLLEHNIILLSFNMSGIKFHTDTTLVICYSVLTNNNLNPQNTTIKIKKEKKRNITSLRVVQLVY